MNVFLTYLSVKLEAFNNIPRQRFIYQPLSVTRVTQHCSHQPRHTNFFEIIPQLSQDISFIEGSIITPRLRSLTQSHSSYTSDASSQQRKSHNNCEGLPRQDPTERRSAAAAEIRSAPAGTASATETAGTAQGKPQPSTSCLSTKCLRAAARRYETSMQRTSSLDTYKPSFPSSYAQGVHIIYICPLLFVSAPPEYFVNVMMLVRWSASLFPNQKPPENSSL